LAKSKPVVREAPQAITIEIIAGRVKKDLVWVVISAVVSVGLGLLAGNFIKL